MLSSTQVDRLLEIAHDNSGHCNTCGRVIKIYKYSINKGMLSTMKAMAKAGEPNNHKWFNMNDVDVAYSQATQRTKMRLHGIIAKYKENGVQQASKWVITTKGWDFLRGWDIPLQVIVFDNQVLGHDGGMTNRRRLGDTDVTYEETPITTPEAEAYHDVRTPQRSLEYKALYTGGEMISLERDIVYTVKIDRLQVGKPIVMTTPIPLTYLDISSFQKSWKIISKPKELPNESKIQSEVV